MRLVVTGGAGFIGTNTIRWILGHVPDVHITCLDALTYAGNRASLAEAEGDERFEFVHGDIRDVALVDRLIADADAVLHLAAETHVDRSIDGPAVFLETNVTGSGVVFDACRRAGVKRVLHVSTDEVYGSIEAPGVFGEDDPLRPSSPYSASKAGADLLARSYSSTYDFPITVARVTNNLGPYQFPEKVVPLFVTNLLDGRSLPLYGDGHNERDWLYVSDTAAGLWRVLVDGEPGEVYNLGAGNGRSNLELARAILARLGHGDEMIERVADRPGHDRRYAVDTTRINALGWAPALGFDDALGLTIDWYRANEAWWRPLKDAGASRRHGAAAGG